MTDKQAKNFGWIFALGAAIVLISALHFLTPLDRIAAHQIYQRLYYLPIVAAALLFGLRGGAAAALFATFSYAPHIALQWHHQTEYALNQYAEIVLFFAFGLIAGFLSDRTRREKERAERINSELQRSYAELRQTFEQLLQAERLAALGELSAGIVHEIRNPLAAIKGAVEILEDGLSQENPRHEFAQIARSEVDRLNKLVSEFVNFARAPKLTKTSTDANALIASVASLLRRQAAAQAVLIEIDLSPNLPKISIDSEQIKQVLLNLAVNALQTMPDGGKLFIRTFRKDDAVIIAVEDTGGGIPAGIIGRIFDPFFTTKEKGLGLGLSVANKIVSQHGGKLDAENNSRGAVFYLSLPCI